MVTEYIGRGMLTILYSEILFIALYSFTSLSVTEVEKWWTKHSVGCGSCLCATVNGVSGKRFPAPHQTVLCPLFFFFFSINLDAHPLGTYETEMAARTRKRSIQTILEQKRRL